MTSPGCARHGIAASCRYDLDVTNADQVGRVADQARDVKILFNNAGVLDFGSVLDASPAAFNRNFDVNFFGLLNVTRALAPTLTENHGAVVNILTLVALASMPGLGVYNASKAAAWSLTQSLRADFAKRQVKVFSVFPGAVDTDMLKGVEMPKTAPADVASEVLGASKPTRKTSFPIRWHGSCTRTGRPITRRSNASSRRCERTDMSALLITIASLPKGRR